MGWTKEALIKKAFGAIGLAAYVYDLSPDQMQSAAQDLDAMMAEWNGKGIRLGYPIASDPEDIDINQQSGLPDSAVKGVYLNLGIAIAPGFGKVVGQDIKADAKKAYDALLIKAVVPIERSLPSNTPAGAGNKTYSSTPFLPDPEPLLDTGTDGTLIYE